MINQRYIQNFIKTREMTWISTNKFDIPRKWCLFVIRANTTFS